MSLVDLSSYNSVSTALYINIEIPGAPLRLSDSSLNTSINGIPYTNKDSLLTVTKTHSNLRATAHELIITATGLSSEVFTAAMNPDTQGSTVEIYRVWSNSDYVLISPSFLKFTGIVNNVSFKEDWNAPNSTYTVAFHCASKLQLLKNRIAGRRTNEDDMKKYYPTDTSFKRVAKIRNSNFNFGSPNKAPKYGTTY